MADHQVTNDQSTSSNLNGIFTYRINKLKKFKNLNF